MQDALSDEDLARALQQGDHGALSALIDRYSERLLRYGGRLLPYERDLGDLVQDVFITVYENIEDFDSTRRFSPWIYRIAHNTFVDRLRKKSREPRAVFDLDKVIPHAVYEDPLPREKELAELRVLLTKGMDELAPAYREVLDLYYFEGLSYRDIADVLHLPVGTVSIRLSRARQALKKKLPKDYGYE